MIRFLSLLLAAFTPWQAFAAPPRVVTDIAPVAALVDGVMAGVGQAGVLLPAGADPHHFQLRSSQARALEDAGAVIWIGPALTPWLAAALPRIAPGAVALALADAPGITRRAPMFGDGEATDPHIWLDPGNQRAMTGAIAGVLAQVDPENADRYRANAAAVIGGIEADETRAQAILAPLHGARLVAAHDAYAHLAAPFGLEITAAVADSEAAEPGARHLRSLRGQIADGGADCLLLEPGHPSKAAESLAADTGIRTTHLDLLGTPGAGETPAPGGFFTGLAREIAACLDAAAP